jgi:tRNA/tmRNA/rRNA uracil-C5-methylase (TrmA/RlmC/RlmD family)
VCPHFLACGGCDLLHADLSLQHALKRRAVAAALGLPIERVEPVVASPKSLGYRALAKLVVSGGVLGSYAPRSHDVVSMEGCPIHDPSVEAIAAAIRVWLRSTEAPHLRHVLIRGSLQERRSIVTIVRWSRDEAASLLARHLGDRSDVARVVVHTNDDAGDALIGAGPSEVPIDRGAPLERIGPIELSLESGAFAQVNPAAAAKLYALVGEMIAPEGKAIADLYSGSGGIALTLEAMGAASVAGVESVEAAVVAARRSSRGRASFACADAASHPIGPVDAVVLNPPRKGAPEGLLRRLSHVPLIVYVSCHPPSLARDLAILGSHRLDRVVPVDMFPQTRHIETVVRLVRA